MSYDEKLMKLYERQEKILAKRETLDEQLKQINKQMKKIEYDKQVKIAEETILVVSKKGINLNDVIKALQNGELDFLKSQKE